MKPLFQLFSSSRKELSKRAALPFNVFTQSTSPVRVFSSSSSRKGMEPISRPSSESFFNVSWSGTKSFSSVNRDFGRNMSCKGYFNKAENDTWSQGRETQQTNHRENKQTISTLETGARSTESVVPSESSRAGSLECAPLSTGVAKSVATIHETEKEWHYQDSHGKIQGPFSMLQLRKWNKTGNFPPNLRVWKNPKNQEDYSVLVTDALDGKFQNDLPIPKAQMVNDSHLTSASSGKSHGTQIRRSTDSQSGGVSWGSQNEINSSTWRGTPSSVEVSKYPADGWGTANLPSPTPSPTPNNGAKRQGFENNWSLTPGGNGMLQSAVHTPESAVRVSGNDGSSSLPGLTSTPNDLLHGQVPDVQNLVSNLQNIVQSVTNHTASDNGSWGSGSVPGSRSQSWRGAPSQKIEPNNAIGPPANNGTLSVNDTGNSAGNLQTAGFSGVPNSDNWRAPVPGNQSYIQPPVQPQAPWALGVADNQVGVPKMGQENQNSGWVQAKGNPNISWGGSMPGNTNLNWVASNQGSGWAPSGQGPPSASANQGWSTPGQGPPLGNVNPASSAPMANQTQNRQPSFGSGGGGGSSGPPFKGQTVCRPFIIPSTFDRTRSEFGLWEDEELCVLNHIYREIAVDIMHNASFRLQNKMINECMRKNLLVTDLVAAFMACVTEVEIIHTVKQLLPECHGKNKAIRDDFINHVGVIKTCNDIEILSVHPFLHTLGRRTTVILSSAGLYHTFTKKNFKSKFRRNPGHFSWEIGYNEAGQEMDESRLEDVDYPIPEKNFTDVSIAQVVNAVEQRKLGPKVKDNLGEKDFLRQKGRAGHLLVFRHCMEHMNDFNPDKPSGLGKRITRVDAINNLHRALGLVCLDVNDFNRKHQAKENFKYDLLESLPLAVKLP